MPDIRAMGVPPVGIPVPGKFFHQRFIPGLAIDGDTVVEKSKQCAVIDPTRDVGPSRRLARRDRTLSQALHPLRERTPVQRQGAFPLESERPTPPADPGLCRQVDRLQRTATKPGPGRARERCLLPDKRTSCW
jgi:hypothetical protein